MNNLQPTSNREPWIDFAKGITLLLVIIGHTVSGVLSGAIYSFHMPLFFILSGITAKLSSSAQQFSDKTQRSFRCSFSRKMQNIFASFAKTYFKNRKRTF